MGPWRRNAAALIVAALGTLGGSAASAQSCAPTAHRVGDGETIFTIAEAKYGDPEKWTLIYYANEVALTASVFQVKPGDMLIIPCEAATQAADATPLQTDVANAELKLLTGSNYEPFTDLDWPGQGMLTELVNAAMEETPDPVSYSITWENDWGKHFPELNAKTFDMGFPWYKPPCDQMPDSERCVNYHFSDPLAEVLMLLFVKDGSDFTFERDEDIFGKTICRPDGFLSFDLDTPERQWLSTGKVTLVRGDDEPACFRKLQNGDVDAVSLNVFLGAQVIKEMGLQGQVVPLDRPVSSLGMHMIISKRHWRGTTFLYRFNAGLAKLKESDRYNEIVSKHLGIFWDRMNVN
ncbi:transporter substrate-binding domain-containing protein [Primorskyibacter sp. 2E107]|uniref:transporter substrate-binding domain-containing protein n=1 Tax=Primorskyibacter sp. 2E107 TaxID=3403458 RepID=UPI003AF7CB15